MTRLIIASLAAALGIGAAVWFSPVWGQASCWQRDHVAAFLKLEHGLSLHSWGLNDAGEMMELFLSDEGHWAVVTTKPNACSSVAMPHKERGRLWFPPKPNYALPDKRLMEDGNPT